MCGRYVRASDKQAVAEAFRTKNDISGLSMPPNDYNIAPSTFQPVIRLSREDDTREMVLMRWGLIPFFIKELSDIKGISTINAKAENVATSPTWRDPFKKRRCLIPVSAFYEWKTTVLQPEDEGYTNSVSITMSRSLPQKLKLANIKKVPYAFNVSGQPIFAFAGLWDAWKDGQGHWLHSFSIITTEANELMSTVHTRMPVILHHRDYDRWLSREVTDQPPVDLLRPFESDEMEMRPANPLVGNVRNNGAEMLNSA